MVKSVAALKRIESKSQSGEGLVAIGQSPVCGFKSTIRGSNLLGGGLSEVGTTNHTGTGALCSALTQPTIEVQPSARHKKCVASMNNPGFQSRRLILQTQAKDTVISNESHEGIWISRSRLTGASTSPERAPFLLFIIPLPVLK